MIKEATCKLVFDVYDWESVNCSAHYLEPCVEDGIIISEIARLLGIGQRLVTHFKHSTISIAA